MSGIKLKEVKLLAKRKAGIARVSKGPGEDLGFIKLRSDHSSFYKKEMALHQVLKMTLQELEQRRSKYIYDADIGKLALRHELESFEHLNANYARYESQTYRENRTGTSNTGGTQTFHQHPIAHRTSSTARPTHHPAPFTEGMLKGDAVLKQVRFDLFGSDTTTLQELEIERESEENGQMGHHSTISKDSGIQIAHYNQFHNCS